MLYTTPGCHHCRRMKQWLQRHGIRFREEDITRSRRAMLQFQRLGGRGVPLLLVGERTIQGFDPKRLVAQLRQMGLITNAVPKRKKAAGKRLSNGDGS